MSALREHLAGDQTDYTVIDNEIKRLKRCLKRYDTQKRRLVGLFRHGKITEDLILDELTTLETERETDHSRLAELEQGRQRALQLTDMESMVAAFYDNVQANLENCTFEDKRLSLAMLDIKVVATPDRVDIQAFIAPTPIQSSDGFTTIERTSA